MRPTARAEHRHRDVPLRQLRLPPRRDARRSAGAHPVTRPTAGRRADPSRPGGGARPLTVRQRPNLSMAGQAGRSPGRTEGCARHSAGFCRRALVDRQDDQRRAGQARSSGRNSRQRSLQPGSHADADGAGRQDDAGRGRPQPGQQSRAADPPRDRGGQGHSQIADLPGLRRRADHRRGQQPRRLQILRPHRAAGRNPPRQRRRGSLERGAAQAAGAAGQVDRRRADFALQPVRRRAHHRRRITCRWSARSAAPGR